MHLSHQSRVVSRSVISELLLLAGVLATAFTYLEVPLWNALLFSVAVIFQAAFGTVMLTRILQGVPASLLLLLGPGLILGGALSFALFQIVARGVIGLVVVIMVGFASVVYLLRSPNWRPLGSERLWIVGQVFGLAALALAWEFQELLPVAVAFFVVGFVTGDMYAAPQWARRLAMAIASVVIVTPLFFRQDYWWIVTDDYVFFEVLSRHFSHSSPFADWGTTNFGKYHWLSYGWNGLLNELGSRPEAFTTLTRVTPLVYSVALAGSLVYVAGYLNKTANWSFALIPVWTLLAINRLDWSGTSTAGVFAVVGAFAAGIVIAVGTTQSFVRRVILYALFGIITVATKLPSVFAIVLLIFCAEVFMFTQQFRTRPRTSVLILSCAVASLGVIPLIWLASRLIGGFAFAGVNPAIGQRSVFGPGFSYLLLSLERLWLILPVVVVLVLPSRKTMGAETPVRLFLLCLAPIALFGVLMEVVMTGRDNTFSYFSGPMYFVASLTLLTVTTSDISVVSPAKKFRILSLITVCIVTFGLIWVRFNMAERLWRQIGTQFFEGGGLPVVLLEYVTFDRRIGATALAIAIIIVGIKIKSLSPQLVAVSLLVSLSSLTLYDYWNNATSEFQREREPSEIAEYFGSPETQLVGQWLQSNTPVHDLIATHNLFDSYTGQPLHNFSLAAWSERVFLFLGTNFFGDYSKITLQLEVSQQFGIAPSQVEAERLRQWGVKWFVVDRLNSPFNDWGTAWDVRYENDQFLVVKL